MITDSMHEVVIIGGGIAGLSAANHLVDVGLRPLLIEMGSYPHHKVCGEFFSPECVSALERWGVQFATTITKARFVTGKAELRFDLPAHPLGLSRFAIDLVLATRVRDRGGIVVENTNVFSLKAPADLGNDYFEISLASGEVVRAQQVIIATGRHSAFAQKHWQPFPVGPTKYLGIKMHFTNLDVDNWVELYITQGAYLGVSMVENGTTNVACLAQTARVQQAGGPEKFMQQLLADRTSSPLLAQRFAKATPVFERWVTCGAPPFGTRKVPHIPGMYFAGDVYGAISPLCGDGLAMAATSGIMAADFLARSDWAGFHRGWKARYHRRLWVGGLLQHALLSPKLARCIIKIGATIPLLPKLMFRLTRERAS